MKIMIVEDHPDMRRVLANIVTMAFLEPPELIEFESGKDAVEQYVLNRPDCVLVDFELKKKMNGFEASKQIVAQILTPRSLW